MLITWAAKGRQKSSWRWWLKASRSASWVGLQPLSKLISSGKHWFIKTKAARWRTVAFHWTFLVSPSRSRTQSLVDHRGETSPQYWVAWHLDSSFNLTPSHSNSYPELDLQVCQIKSMRQQLIWRICSVFFWFYQEKPKRFGFWQWAERQRAGREHWSTSFRSHFGAVLEGLVSVCVCVQTCYLSSQET